MYAINRFLAVVLLGLTVTASAAVAADVEVVSEAGNRQELSLVVYNQNIALVRESRSVNLPRGKVELRLEGIGRMLLPSSVIAEPGGRTRLIEQRYLYDPLNRSNLLDAYVGRKLMIERENERTGVTEKIEAVLLANDGAGPVLEVDGHVLLEPGGRIVLPELPEGLVARPVLSWLLDSGQQGERQIGLSYLSNGISWQSEYVLAMGPGESNATLAGWVTLRNNSGADFRDAEIHLMAGNINRATRPDYIPAPEMMEMRTSLAAKGPVDDGMQATQQFEYYRYDLPGRTDLLHNQASQVELFAARAVDVKKIYRFSGSQRYFHSAQRGQDEPVPADVILEWNSGGMGKDKPLPAGLVRIYDRDSGGTVWFAGEDRIGHTPSGDKVSVSAGSAFDVRGIRRQLDFQRPSDRLRRVTVEIEIINSKDSAVTVQVDEPLPGDWKITDSSHDWDKLQSNLVRFAPRVGAGERVKVRYTMEFI